MCSCAECRRCAVRQQGVMHLLRRAGKDNYRHQSSLDRQIRVLMKSRSNFDASADAANDRGQKRNTTTQEPAESGVGSIGSFYATTTIDHLSNGKCHHHVHRPASITTTLSAANTKR